MRDRADDRQLSGLKAFLEVSRELGATIELLPLLQKVELGIRQILGCERGTVFLYDKSAEQLYSLVATGEEQIRFSAKLGIAGQALQTRSLIVVHDAYADQRFNRAIDRITGYRTRNLLTLPMRGYDGSVVGVLQALNKYHGSFDSQDEERATDLGMLAGVALQRQMLLDEYAEKQRLERDLALARDIQQKLLPTENPTVVGYQIAGWSKPADATGGDCYDYLKLDGGRVGILLADVTGHGIGPALIVSECRALVRALASASSDPAAILTRANRLLSEDLDSGRFVTAFFGVLDPQTHHLNYLSAGQGPLLHFRRSSGSCLALPATTYPLGIMPEMEEPPPQFIRLSPGDLVVLPTDGFLEWTNPKSEQFGVSRLVEVMNSCRDHPPEQMIAALHRQVVRFASGTPQSDDVTAVIIKRMM